MLLQCQHHADNRFAIIRASITVNTPSMPHALNRCSEFGAKKSAVHERAGSSFLIGAGERSSVVMEFIPPL